MHIGKGLVTYVARHARPAVCQLRRCDVVSATARQQLSGLAKSIEGSSASPKQVARSTTCTAATSAATQRPQGFKAHVFRLLGGSMGCFSVLHTMIASSARSSGRARATHARRVLAKPASIWGSPAHHAAHSHSKQPEDRKAHLDPRGPLSVNATRPTRPTHVPQKHIATARSMRLTHLSHGGHLEDGMGWKPLGHFRRFWGGVSLLPYWVRPLILIRWHSLRQPGERALLLWRWVNWRFFCSQPKQVTTLIPLRPVKPRSRFFKADSFRGSTGRGSRSTAVGSIARQIAECVVQRLEHS